MKELLLRLYELFSTACYGLLHLFQFFYFQSNRKITANESIQKVAAAVFFLF